MNSIIIALVSAMIGGSVVAWVNYLFGLRQANKQKRKEIVVSHLIGAYLAFEDYALRDPTSLKHNERAAAIEKATASIFLFGDAKAIALLKDVDRVVKQSGEFDVKELALYLRVLLRQELALDRIEDNAIIHFRGPSS